MTVYDSSMIDKFISHIHPVNQRVQTKYDSMIVIFQKTSL